MSLWLHWLITHHKSSGITDACIPTTSQSGSTLETIERIASLQYPTGDARYHQFVSALSAGQVELNVTDTWKVVGMSTPNLKRALLRCTSPFVVLGLRLAPVTPGLSGHRNALIINNSLRTYERFEPNGAGFAPDVDRFLDSREFRSQLPDPNYKYISVEQSCPRLGPQAVASVARHCEKRGGDGFCVVFSMMYLHLRLLMPLSTSDEVYEMWLTLDQNQLTETIIRYYGWVTSVLGKEEYKHNVTVSGLKQLVSPSVRV